MENPKNKWSIENCFNIVCYILLFIPYSLYYIAVGIILNFKEITPKHGNEMSLET